MNKVWKNPYQQRYYENNKAKVMKKQMEYYENNKKELLKAQRKRYNENNFSKERKVIEIYEYMSLTARREGNEKGALLVDKCIKVLKEARINDE